MADISVKTIEDLSLNAWPSYQLQLYDGWILRYSSFYTHRTNCVEQIGESTLPLPEKVAYCEGIYKRWQTPSIFKISPLTDPALEPLLVERGYHVEHKVTNMVMDFAEVPPVEPDLSGFEATAAQPDALSESSDAAQPAFKFRLGHRVTNNWLTGLFALKGTTNKVHLRIVPSMYAAIPKDEIVVTVLDGEGCIAATGLGILDRDFIGVYAIHVRDDLRRRGIARAVVQTILWEGQKAGARYSYLQVVSDNTAARGLYTSLGFTPLYDAWFRVKDEKTT